MYCYQTGVLFFLLLDWSNYPIYSFFWCRPYVCCHRVFHKNVSENCKWKIKWRNIIILITIYLHIFLNLGIVGIIFTGIVRTRLEYYISKYQGKSIKEKKLYLLLVSNGMEKLIKYYQKIFSLNILYKKEFVRYNWFSKSVWSTYSVHDR